MSYGAGEPMEDMGTAREVEAKLRAGRPARPEPDRIADELGALDEGLEELEAVLGRMIDRLGPVLRPDGEQNAPADVGAIRPARSELREVLEAKTAHVRHLRRTITAVTDRIDL